MGSDLPVTKRPETVGAIEQAQSQRWLESRGFTLPSVYVVQGSGLDGRHVAPA